jgi:poly(3-hydroxybutyrate) depolymerase
MIAPASAREAASATRKLTFHEIPGPQPREFFLYRPLTERAGAPLVVSVHGIARNAAAHAYRLMEEAERYGVAVAAPLFSKERYGQYQQLLDSKLSARSDLALLDILDAAERLTSADTSEILLFGYSGGAQFAHRFAMAHPKRVTSAALAASGWYTFPIANAPFPYGLDTGGSELSFDPHAMLRVRYHVMVGDLDTERDSSLRQSKRLDRAQGHTRVERARNWTIAMKGLANEVGMDASVSLLTLPSVGHSFVESVERAALPRLIFERFAADSGISPIRSGV